MSGLVIGVLRDLAASAEIGGALRPAGFEFKSVRRPEDLPDHLNRDPVLAVVNLELAGAEAVLGEITARKIPVAGYFPHVRPELAEAAARFPGVRCYTRSKFFSRIVEVVRENLAGEGAGHERTDREPLP